MIYVIFLETPLPHNNPLSESSITMRVTFELFSIDTISLIFKSMLSEYKILFVSQHSILTLVAEVFRSFLYPFDWQHVYIPIIILPEDVLMFLRAPTVYICTHESLLPSLDELPSHTLVANVNNGKVRRTEDSITIVPLPKHEFKKLERFLQPVSQVLLVTKSQELDLPFPVAPTSDEIEQHEEMQQVNFEACKGIANNSSSDSNNSNINNNNRYNNNSSNNKNSSTKTGYTKSTHPFGGICKYVKCGKKRGSDENNNNNANSGGGISIAGIGGNSSHTNKPTKHAKSKSIHINADGPCAPTVMHNAFDCVDRWYDLTLPVRNAIK